MIVYHGSNVVVQNPDLVHSRKMIDFGRGFYLTEDYEMACKWVSMKKGATIINTYDLDVSNLNIVKFRLTEKWLNYVSANRGFGNRHFNDRNTDVIIGPTADDRLFTTLSLYWSKMLSKEHTLLFLNAVELSEQIVLKSPMALQHLHFISYQQLTQEEKNMYRQQASQHRDEALLKIDKIRQQLVNESHDLDTREEYVDIEGDEEYER